MIIPRSCTLLRKRHFHLADAFVHGLQDMLHSGRSIFDSTVLSTIPGGAWWPAIAMTTVLLRSVFFPVKIVHHKNQLLMQAAQQEYAQRHAPLLDRIKDNAERQVKSREQLGILFRERGVRISKVFLPICVNVPLFLGMSRALREMSYGDGMEWLATGDWRMALITVCVNGVVLQASRHFIRSPLDQNQQNSWTLSKLMVPGLHVLNAASFLLLQHMPVAVNWYFAVSNGMTFAENSVLRSNWAKQYFNRQGIPVLN